MSKQVKLALIGAGNRGQGIFGQYALDMPHRAKFIAVVEPDQAKREFFAANHKIADDQCFSNLHDFLASGAKEIEAVIIATLEDARLEPVFEAMKKRYHILVEKPLCTDANKLIDLYDNTINYDKILIVCHQMRLIKSMRTIKSMIDSGRYGKIVAVQHSENLSYSHMAHSFVRGFFNNDRLTPMLLAKSCHDMDILTHFINRPAVKVASFGSLNYFKPANAPKGAPKFCLDGCPAYQSCPYNVLKLYFEPDTDQAYLRQMGVIKSKEQLMELLKTNRFGRCVFQTDNNVVDNQTVIIEFEDDIHVSFTMCGHNGIERRISKFSMTNGEIEFDFSTGVIKAHTFEPLLSEEISVQAQGSHAGGDRAIMDNFVDAIESGDTSILLTPIKKSLEGHLLVFAAEKSRKENIVVNVREFEAELRKQNKK